jgi:hypothetical protein
MKMDFGDALRALKDGKRVAREGWNGVWLALVIERTIEHRRASWGLLYPTEPDEDFPHHLRSVWPGPFTLSSWIGMKTVDGRFAPWVASQADMLADDWTEESR